MKEKVVLYFFFADIPRAKKYAVLSEGKRKENYVKTVVEAEGPQLLQLLVKEEVQKAERFGGKLVFAS